MSASYAITGGSMHWQNLTSFPVQHALGKQLPSVFGANLYNQQLALSSDSEVMDT